MEEEIIQLAVTEADAAEQITAAASSLTAVSSATAAVSAEETSAVENAVNAVGQEFANQTKNILRLDELQQYFTWGTLAKIIVSVVTFILFYIIYRFIKKIISSQSTQKKHIKKETADSLNKAVTYVFWALMLLYFLSLIGIDLKGVWGAAGIAGVAIGFAAQTSVSNLISGLFVLSEKAMKIGDFIEVDDVCGTIDSIGLLSVKVHTLDNQMVRIPNSTIINSDLKNYNTFKTRRFVMELPVAYENDLQKVLEVISKVPSECKYVLEKPAASVYCDGFSSQGAVIKIAVWINSCDLTAVKNELYVAVSKACKKNRITIPYLHYEKNKK